ncbi:copper transporter [Corynebacterium timonense]|uniref:Copper transport outer membrane protein, MctB n=1 Tax=Corynebacterium timonense TaxID=441500 RepID=A0A1H1PFK0_9CORY|nr:copper transporter [Corynebacterium timonense]SDS09775.1 Copper transport outer membrane protein, MctB [Corynebacterium timonense]
MSGGRGGLVVAGLAWGTALGVALGSLVMAPAVQEARGTGVEEPAAQDLTPRVEEAEAQAAAANELVATEAGALVGESLADTAVLIIRSPGTAPEDTNRLRELLGQAGADDAGEIALTEKFVSRQGADELGSVVANTLPAGAQLSPDNLSPATHAGESLAVALFAGEDGAPRATLEDRDFVLSALADAGFLTYHSPDLMAADAVIVVTGGEEEPFAVGALADFAAALNARGGAVVAAEQGPGGEVAGELHARGGQGVATQNVVDTEAGAVLSVRAVREALDAE